MSTLVGCAVLGLLPLPPGLEGLDHGVQRTIRRIGIMEQEHHFGDWWSRTDFGFNGACPIRLSSRR
jgi:hypothetical protein